MRLSQLSAIALAVLLLPVAGASAQNNMMSESKEGYEWLGPYAKLGLSIGFPDEDVDVDVDPGAGFDLAGGWRLTPWLAGEIDINFIAGADIEGIKDDGSIFAFTFNAKAYPLGAFEMEGVSDNVQPYLLFGIGGGEVAVDDRDESTFMARFGGGIDWWLNENWGLYFDGGYIVIDEEDTFLDGEGLLVFGGMYRF